MNGTMSFEGNREDWTRSHGMSARRGRRWGRAKRGIVWVMAIADRRSWSLLRGRFSARATKNRKRPVEAAGAVDAKNAPTAPWKTAQTAVFHSYHRLFLLHW